MGQPCLQIENCFVGTYKKIISSGSEDEPQVKLLVNPSHEHEACVDVKFGQDADVWSNCAMIWKEFL